MKIKVRRDDSNFKIIKPKNKTKYYNYLWNEMDEIAKKIDGLVIPKNGKKYTERASEQIQKKLKEVMNYECEQDVADVLVKTKTINFKSIKTKHRIDLVKYPKNNLPGIGIEIEMTKNTNLLTDLIKLSIAGKPYREKRAIEHGLIIVQSKYKSHYSLIPAVENYYKLMSSAYWPRTLGVMGIELK